MNITKKASAPENFSSLARVATVALCLLAAACNDSPAQPVSSNSGASGMPAELAGTSWQLVEIQSMDDSIGTSYPDDPSKYTMRLLENGDVSMVLNCNNATGRWTATAASDDSGTFEFGPLAVTRALCPPPSLDERIAADTAYVRGYLLRDGRLALSLMADAGIYIWESVP